MLTAEGVQITIGGAQLLSALARTPAASTAIKEQGQLAELHFKIAAQAPTSPHARLHNWQSVFWVMEQVSGEEVDPDEKSLVVAQDCVILSSVLHRLAASMALRTSAKGVLASSSTPPTALTSHKAVAMLCQSAERHLDVDAEQIERLLLFEQDKFVYLLTHPERLPQRVDGIGREGRKTSSRGAETGSAVEEFLRDMYVRSSDLADALRNDVRGVSVILWALSRGCTVGCASTVVAGARAVGGVTAALLSGRETAAAVGEWLVCPHGDGRGSEGDGLGVMLSAVKRFAKNEGVADAVAEALRNSCRHEDMPALLSVELYARLNAAKGRAAGEDCEEALGKYSSLVADLLPGLVRDVGVARELEWQGVLPHLMTHVVRHLRAMPHGGHQGDGGPSRTAGMQLLAMCWRCFSRALVASQGFVGEMMTALRQTLAGNASYMGAEGAKLTATYRGSCEVLLVLIDLKCSAAGALYNLLAEAYQLHYAHTPTRLEMQAFLSKALRKSAHMPTAPLARRLAPLVASSGWASAPSSVGGPQPGDEREYDVVVTADEGLAYMGDVGFWRLIAEHPRSAPGDVMSMLELMATAMVKDDKAAAFASDCLVSLCRTLLRHTSVRALVQRTVGRVVAAVIALSSAPARAPPGAIYEGGDRHEGHSHKQTLMAHLSLLGAAEGSRHLVIDALRQSLGESGEEVDDAAYQALESLLASIQGQGRLSVSPTLLPHVHGVPLPVEGTGTRAGAQDGWAPGANGPETSAAPLAGQVGRGGAEEMEDKSRERRRLRLEDFPSAEVEKPKAKGRAHDKKKRMGADKDQGAEAACVQAFRLRALKSPEEVFAVMLPDDKLRELAGANSVRESLKPLKLSAATLAHLFKAVGWDAKQSKKVSDVDFVRIFAWPAEGGEGQDRSVEEVEQSVDAAIKRRREIAAVVRKRLNDAEKMLKKKAAADLDEALAKCAEIEELSAPPPGQQPVKPQKTKKKSVPKRPPPAKRVIKEADPPKPLFKLEKIVLELLVKTNPLLHVEPDVDDTWMSASPRVLMALPLQLVRLGLFDKAVHICCCLHWVQQAVREVGVFNVLQTMNSLWQALHAGQGRDAVDDYLDFLEQNADGLSLDPSRIFALARHEHSGSTVHLHSNKAVVNGESLVAQNLARVRRLQTASVSALHKALSYSRGQRSLVRLMSRGIVKCFSKAQKEKLSKCMNEIHASLELAMNELRAMTAAQVDASLAEAIGSWQHVSMDTYGTRLDAHGRAQLMYDIMDVVGAAWKTRLAPSLPPAPLPLCGLGAGSGGEEDADLPEEVLGCREGQLMALDDQVEEALACWPEVRVFVSASSPDVSHERKMLLDFVLPALRVLACTRRVALSWTDPGSWHDPSENGAAKLADGLDQGQLEHTRDICLQRLRAMQACRIPTIARNTSTPSGHQDGARVPRQPFAVFVVGQRLDEPLLSGRVLKESLRVSLVGEGGVGDGNVVEGANYGWLRSSLGEEQSRMLGPTDIEIMDGVFFRQSPSAVVLLKMSIVTEDDKWLQVVREEEVRQELQAAHEIAAKNLWENNDTDDEEGGGGLQGEMMAVIDSRQQLLDPDEEADPLFLEFVTSLTGFNRPHPHNEAALTAHERLQDALQSASRADQLRHNYSQCRMGGVERLGVEAYRRLAALLLQAYPTPDDLTASEMAEKQSEASRTLLLQRACVPIPSRQAVIASVCDHVGSILRNPDADASSQDDESRASAKPMEKWQNVVRIGGRHGSGVSVVLAQLAQQLELQGAHLRWPGGCHVIYMKSQRWHSDDYLAWYLCSCVAMNTAVRPSWMALHQLLLRRSVENKMATIFVLDGVSEANARSLADTVHAARQAGALAVAVLAVHPALNPLPQPGDVAAATSPVSAAKGQPSAPLTLAKQLPALECLELVLPDMSVEETRELVAGTMRSLAALGTGADLGGGSKSVAPELIKRYEDKVRDVLERLPHPRASCAGLPLYIVSICALALLRGVVGLTSLPDDVCKVWEKSVLPALEERHGRQHVMWVLLALHYEPTGLLPSQMACEQPADWEIQGGVVEFHSEVGMGHPKDFLAPDQTASHVSIRAQQMLADLTVLLARSFAAGGQSIVLESVSLRHAVEQRYFIPWKRTEEEAAKPGLPGVKKPPNPLHSLALPHASKREAAVVGGAKQNIANIRSKAKMIRARKGLKGVNASIQTRLMQLFDSVVDAFQFLDQNGDEKISIVELGHGFKRMGITGVDMKKLGAAVASDGVVDLYEFLRLFAWEDIPVPEHAVKSSRLRYQMICETAVQRRKELGDLDLKAGATASGPSPPKKKMMPSSSEAVAASPHVDNAKATPDSNAAGATAESGAEGAVDEILPSAGQDVSFSAGINVLGQDAIGAEPEVDAAGQQLTGEPEEGHDAGMMQGDTAADAEPQKADGEDDSASLEVEAAAEGVAEGAAAAEHPPAADQDVEALATALRDGAEDEGESEVQELGEEENNQPESSDAKAQDPAPAEARGEPAPARDEGAEPAGGDEPSQGERPAAGDEEQEGGGEGQDEAEAEEDDESGAADGDDGQ